MKYFILRIFLLSAVFAPLSVALTDEETILIMDEKPIEGYDLNPATSIDLSSAIPNLRAIGVPTKTISSWTP